MYRLRIANISIGASAQGDNRALFAGNAPAGTSTIIDPTCGSGMA